MFKIGRNNILSHPPFEQSLELYTFIMLLPLGHLSYDHFRAMLGPS